MSEWGLYVCSPTPNFFGSISINDVLNIGVLAKYLRVYYQLPAVNISSINNSLSFSFDYPARGLTLCHLLLLIKVNFHISAYHADS